MQFQIGFFTCILSIIKFGASSPVKLVTVTENPNGNLVINAETVAPDEVVRPINNMVNR